MSGEQLGFEGTLEQSIDSGTTWDNIANVTNIPIPAAEPEYVEITSLDSNGFREYVKGLQDIGEISIRQNYSRAGFQQQQAAEALDTAILYRFTMANGDVLQWAGIPRVRFVDSDLGQQNEFETVVRGSGALNFTAGS